MIPKCGLEDRKENGKGSTGERVTSWACSNPPFSVVSLSSVSVTCSPEIWKGNFQKWTLGRCSAAQGSEQCGETSPLSDVATLCVPPACLSLGSGLAYRLASVPVLAAKSPNTMSPHLRRSPPVLSPRRPRIVSHQHLKKGEAGAMSYLRAHIHITSISVHCYNCSIVLLALLWISYCA